MTSTPLVSILIPCYNAERWIAEAIDSALAQTYPAKEVIVVDDGSRDGSWAVIRGFGDRIRAETGPNRGGNPTRNRLLELARGEWVQYLDADDYLKPDKVAGQVAALERHPGVDVLFGPVIMAWQMHDQAPREEFRPIAGPVDDPWVLLATWELPQTGVPLWRRQAILDVGGWKPDQPCCQEHELYCRLLMNGRRFAYDPAGGAVYRQWSDGTVCKRNLPQVHTKRLEIEDRAQAHLSERRELTPARLRAFCQARFEIARGMWHYDRPGATALMERVRRENPRFVPAGEAAPGAFRLVYRVLGYPMAEKIAAWRRRLSSTRSGGESSALPSAA